MLSIGCFGLFKGLPLLGACLCHEIGNVDPLPSLFPYATYSRKKMIVTRRQASVWSTSVDYSQSLIPKVHDRRPIGTGRHSGESSLRFTTLGVLFSFDLRIPLLRLSLRVLCTSSLIPK